MQGVSSVQKLVCYVLMLIVCLFLPLSAWEWRVIRQRPWSKSLLRPSSQVCQVNSDVSFLLLFCSLLADQLKGSNAFYLDKIKVTDSTNGNESTRNIKEKTGRIKLFCIDREPRKDIQRIRYVLDGRVKKSAFSFHVRRTLRVNLGDRSEKTIRSVVTSSSLLFLAFQFCLHLTWQESICQRAHNSHEPRFSLSPLVTSRTLDFPLPESLSSGSSKPCSQRAHGGGSSPHTHAQINTNTNKLTYSSQLQVLLVKCCIRPAKHWRCILSVQCGHQRPLVL